LLLQIGVEVERFEALVGRRLPVLRFLEQNQAAVHHLMTEGQEAVLRTYGEEIIPKFSGVKA